MSCEGILETAGLMIMLPSSVEKTKAALQLAGIDLNQSTHASNFSTAELMSVKSLTR
jgi:hypothetical protein